jgi:hypothetical protein
MMRAWSMAWQRSQVQGEVGAESSRWDDMMGDEDADGVMVVLMVDGDG